MPNVGTISGSMVLDPSAYLNGLNQAAGATQSFKNTVEGVQFAGFNRGIFATTSLLYGLNRIMSSMSRGMEDYSNILGRIGTVADLTAASVQALADSMKEVSVAYGVSRKDIMGGMYTAAQSRFTSPAEMRAMGSAGALLSHASGGEINVKKAVGLLSGTRQALGIGMDAVTSKRLTDMMLRGRDIGRWELGQMATTLSKVTSVYGSQYGHEVDGEEILRQLVAMMATASLTDLPLGMVSTGVRRMVEKTLTLAHSGVGKNLRRALTARGFGGDNPILTALNQSGPLQFAETLMDITEGGRSELLSFYGYKARELQGLTSFMRQGGEHLRRSYADVDYGTMAGTSDKYTEAMKGTYQYARQQLRSQWEITSQEFMNASIPLIGEFTNMLSGLNRVAQSLPDGVKSFMMLVSALTSFRLALNFLGVRGPILRSLFMPGAGGVAGGAVAGGAGGGMAGMAAMAAMGGMDYQGHINALIAAGTPPVVPKGIEFKTVAELEKQSVGIEKKGHYFRLRDGSGKFTKVTSRDPNMPFIYENARRQKYGLAPIFRQPKAPFGSGFISGVAPMTGLYGGMALGERMAGEDGGMFLPMAMGIGGMGVASKLAGAYASGGMAGALGGVKAGALGASKILPHVLTAYTLMKLGKGTYKGIKGHGPLSVDEELAYMMRGRSKHGLVRGFGETSSTLELLPLFFMGKGKEAIKMIRRGRYTFSPLDIATRYSLEKLLPSMKMELADKGLLDMRDLLKNKEFSEFFKEQTKEDLDTFIRSEQHVTDPTAWGDRLSDIMRGFVEKSINDKLRAKMDKERERLVSQKKLFREHKPQMLGAYARLSGYDTMFGLDPWQRSPFQPEYGNVWQDMYRSTSAASVDKYMLGGFSQDYLTEMSGISDKLGLEDDKKSPFSQIKDRQKRLVAQKFMLQHGLDIRDSGKVSDDQIIKAFGLDIENTPDDMMQRILGQIRGADPGQWMQMFGAPKSPFSTAMYYGSQGAYDATLERKDQYEMKVLFGKLDQFIDAVEGTKDGNESKLTDYEKQVIDGLGNISTELSGILSAMSGGELPDL